MSLWTSSFFGLPAGYRTDFHSEIFSLWYYGGGGNLQDLYELPVEKRKFFLQLLEKTKKDEKDAMESNQKGQTSTPKIPSYHKQHSIPKK